MILKFLFISKKYSLEIKKIKIYFNYQNFKMSKADLCVTFQNF